jgi:hypothetical protein
MHSQRHCAFVRGLGLVLRYVVRATIESRSSLEVMCSQQNIHYVNKLAATLYHAVSQARAVRTSRIQRGLLQLLSHRALQLLRADLEALQVLALLLLQLLHPATSKQ